MDDFDRASFIDRTLYLRYGIDRSEISDENRRYYNSNEYIRRVVMCVEEAEANNDYQPQLLPDMGKAYSNIRRRTKKQLEKEHGIAIFQTDIWSPLMAGWWCVRSRPLL